jgi:hypothetical protein
MAVSRTGMDEELSTAVPGRTATFAVVAPVGPGDREVERVRDLLESLETFEGGNYRFVLVDDQQGPSRFSSIVPETLRDRFTEIKNPRNGRGSGWAAGCAVAVLTGLNELAKAGLSFEFVLKLDTDALVIRPFSQALSRMFAIRPEVGMVGTIRDPNMPERGDETVRPLGRALDKLMKQFTVWRATKCGGLTFQIALWGRFRLIRDTIRHAFINGFRVGEHCYGGGYALSHACIRALQERGLLARPCVWLPTPLVEDMIVSLCVKSVDLALQDASGQEEPFAIRFRGLPDRPENLVARGHSIIHSVKDFGDLKEADVRSYFRQRRLREATV